MATLLLSITVSNILSKGISESKKRVGADIMIISAKSKLGTKSFLYSGEFANKFIYKKDLDFLKKYSEIEKTTEEFFTHTLSAGCCTVGEKLRIVGIDQDTDFLIKPWLEEQGIKHFKDSQVLIGSDVAIPLGSKMGLLGAPFTLIGSLYRTGTGMDRTVFMNINVARKLAKKKMQKSIFEGHDPSELITALFIKLKPDSDPKIIAEKINNEQNIVIAASKAETITKMEKSLRGWQLVLVSIIFIVVLNSILSLFGRFSFLMKERKKEIGYLRALGISKQRIFLSLLAEIVIIALVGGFIGALIALIIMNPALELISKQFLTPKTTINLYNIVFIFILGPIIAFLIGTASGLIPFVKTAKMEPREAMAKGEK